MTDMQEVGEDKDRANDAPVDMSPKRSRMMTILFRIFTILEFGFLGFILYDLFRKYILTGNLDWWKK
ncbi:hypothetical protein ACSYAY_02700 [Leptospirillum ferriphilum]|jgi:hypothetical protein|uniref:Uncharacterized protein n=4 Tax=Leptospirillum TaxID=179 RepID=A0A059XSX1_9BACT|nr:MULTISPECIES: hypothetical protein [Leptospirillum]EAY57890.1 MAG: hypothetical protein UBAL2_82410293 [Leptospirillum rubarum]EDZ39702.1 MAG: Hypothetical protein CGL2_11184043 [Leptospirillum sp. Group II '5-way CG']EIJ75923.1 MAG: Hypothetical protein C75L2_00100006 [Leptospirillum sp. Group II 'C75']AFS52403.1 hypothetical protein LFML04_0151 [Leptospirillum ferriphilum ML-04]AIA29903.1 hypothetical protein Y981_00865 [Leptospirillum ferriphilum YSK]